jgi:hypothetical protein
VTEFLDGKRKIRFSIENTILLRVRIGTLVYRKLHHESVDNAPHHRDEVKGVPGVAEVALQTNTTGC